MTFVSQTNAIIVVFYYQGLVPQTYDLSSLCTNIWFARQK